MSKVLDLILELKSDMSSNWQDRLDKINILPDVKILYGKGYSQTFSNRLLAFIILAYDNKSGWVEIHKDRWENKRKIWKRLGGEIDDLTRSIIHNENELVNHVVAWYLDYQRDWRWQSIATCFEYHSEMMRFGGFRTLEEIVEDGDDTGEKITKEISTDKVAKANTEKGSNIQKGIEHRLKGEAMLDEIRRDFVSLDTITDKEGAGKITETTNPMSWASFLRNFVTPKND